MEESYSLSLAKQLCRILYDGKAQNIELYAVTNVAPFTDYYVLATGRSTTHMRALESRVEDESAKEGVFAAHREGLSGDSWYLVDFSHVIVHIFSPAAREFYHLERLVGKENQIPVTDFENGETK